MNEPDQIPEYFRDPELDGLDLEEIMKEFAGEEEQQAPAAPVQPEDAAEAPQEAADPGEVTEDPDKPHRRTKLLGKHHRESGNEATQAIPTVAIAAPVDEPEDKGKTRRLPKILGKHSHEDAAPAPQASDETQKIPEPVQPEQEPQEPEYVPYKPIHFQPKDRLRSLKRKLVAGPEKRYYELSEVGVGKLQIAILFALLVFVLSAVVTAMDATGHVPQDRRRLMVFVQYFCMLTAALLGCYQLMGGITDLFKGRFSMNTLLAFSFVACCADSGFCFREERVPCCAAFSLQVAMSLWGSYHKRITEMGQMDTLRKASRIYGVYSSRDYYEGCDGLLRFEGDVDDFTQNYQAPSGPEKAISWYGVLALFASVGIGVAGGVLQNNVSFGVRVGSAALLAAMPVTAFITLTRPYAILQKRLHSVGGVLCGWQGVKGMCDEKYFAMSHEDLFPVGTCKLNGVKFFSDRDRSQVISYAWALVEPGGGALVPLFDHLLQTQGGVKYTAKNLRTYANGGVGGEVRGESVLVGTLSFQKEMGVEVPEGIRVNQAVYISIDGELCGLVAVTYVKDRDSAVGLGTLSAHRRLHPILTTGDFMLTQDFIRSKFNVSTKRIVFPEQKDRKELSAKKPDKDMPALALTTKDNFASYAYCVTGARTLRTAQLLGLVVHILAGVVGIGLIAALAVLGAVERLTPVNMLLYQLVWLLPGLLLTEWTRHI